MAVFGVAALLLAVMQLDQFKPLDDLDRPAHHVFFAQVCQPFLISALAVLSAMKIYSISNQKETVMGLILSLGISFQLVIMLVLGFRVCQHAWSHPSVVTARQQHTSVFLDVHDHMRISFHTTG